MREARRGEFAQLRVRTDPAITQDFRYVPEQRRPRIVDTSRPPLAVVVCMADVVEAGAGHDTRVRVERLRALATNWCASNRLHATFVSNVSGVGVAAVIDRLVQQLLERDATRGRADTPRPALGGHDSTGGGSAGLASAKPGLRLQAPRACARRGGSSMLT